MLDDVYNTRILELAADVPRRGRLPHPDASATVRSKLCGSTVTIDIAVADGRVQDFAHESKACALGTAAASIMARNIIGATPADLRAGREALRAMLKEGAAPPAHPRWADLAVLQPVRDHKSRHASTLLPFDAVVKALDDLQLF